MKTFCTYHPTIEVASPCGLFDGVCALCEYEADLSDIAEADEAWEFTHPVEAAVLRSVELEREAARYRRYESRSNDDICF